MSLVRFTVEATEDGTFHWEKTNTDGEEVYYQVQDGRLTITFRTGVSDAIKFSAPNTAGDVFLATDSPSTRDLLSRLKIAIESQLVQPTAAD